MIDYIVHMAVWDTSQTPMELLCGAAAEKRGPGNWDLWNCLRVHMFLNNEEKQDWETWCPDCENHPKLGLHLLAAMELE